MSATLRPTVGSQPKGFKVVKHLIEDLNPKLLPKTPFYPLQETFGFGGADIRGFHTCRSLSEKYLDKIANNSSSFEGIEVKEGNKKKVEDFKE
jgi:hypothetical protein